MNDQFSQDLAKDLASPIFRIPREVQMNLSINEEGKTPLKTHNTIGNIFKYLV